MDTTQVARHRDQLLELRRRAQDEYGGVSRSLSEDVRAPGDVSDTPTHNADHDVEGVEEEVRMGTLLTERLEQIDAALERVEQGTYGRCQDCGQDIPEERLEAIPYTPYCVPCEEKREQAVDDLS